MPLTNSQFPTEHANTFMARMEYLVKEIIIQNNISYYRISSVMDYEQTATADSVPTPVIRIVTYFEDAIAAITNLIRFEFDIVKDQPTIDSAKQSGFSTKQVEYLATLTPARQQLLEYKRIGQQLFKIQICSILQDAWKGMEKELNYDNTAYPEQLKRDLFRVSALLEMAEIEFEKIKSATILGGVSASESSIKAESVSAKQAATVEVASIAANEASLKKPADEFYEEYNEPVSTPPVQFNVKPTYVSPSYNYKSGNNLQQPVAPVTNHAEPVKQEVPSQPTSVAEVAKIVEAEPIPQAVVNTTNPELISENLFPDVKSILPLQEDLLSAANDEHVTDGKLNMSVMDMNVATPDNLSMNLNRVGASNLETNLPEIVDSAITETTENLQMEGTNSNGITTSASTGDAVALNIDNVEMFNLNVNGMIERRTEVVVDKDKDEDESIPFYEREAKPQKPVVLDENTTLTDAALREYVATSRLVKEVDSEIAKRAGAVLNSEVDVEGDVERLKFLKVYNLKQLHERISDNKADVVAFAEKWIGTDNGGSFDSGICLFYLEYLLVGKKNDPAFAVEYVLKFISDNDYSARFIIPTYNSISKTEIPIASHLTLK